MILGNPLFLIGLVALLIPIAVHLFNFRRYRKVYFSNVEFIEQLQSETRRQSNLRRLLILLARLLAVAFLVLAFAKPMIPGNADTMRKGSNDVSIYVDNSFSMEAADSDGILLEKAKQKAREIVAAYGPTDRFQILTNDVEGRQFHWLTKEEALSAIDGIETSPATLTLSAMGRKQYDFLHGGTGENRYAYVVSDFQLSVTDIANFPADTDVSPVFVPLEAARRGNFYIDTVMLNAPVFYKGGSVVVQVRLSNESDENLEKVPLSLTVNGRQRAIASVDLPADGSAVTEMHFTIDESGILSGKVETTDYPVTFDDSYFFSLNIKDCIRMLVVEGGGGNEYLHRLFDGDSVVHCSTMSVQQMDFSRIEGNDVILLDELTSLTTGMAQSLHSFVEEGGTLVVVPSDNADIQSYNEALSLFAAPRIESRSNARIAASTVNTGHSLYLNVFNGKTENMEMPTVTGYFRFVASASALREPVITLSNGDDYVSSIPCGNGRLFLVAAPLRDANTDFVRQALFVPTFYNMALYSLHPSAPAMSLDRTEPFPLSGKYGPAAGTMRLTAVDGSYEEIPDIRQNGGVSMLVPHGSLRSAGNYLLVMEGKNMEGISINYSRLESNMECLGTDGLSRLLKDNGIESFDVVRNADKPLDRYIKEKSEGHQLWHWCVILCLLMLLAEILLIRIPATDKKRPSKTPLNH